MNGKRLLAFLLCMSLLLGALPVTSAAVLPGWAQVYQQILRDRGNSGSYPDLEYALYDMDGDNRPELLTRTSNLYCYFFRYIRGDIDGIRMAGESKLLFYSRDGEFYRKDGGLVVFENGRDDLHYEYINYFPYSDGILGQAQALASTQQMTHQELLNELRTYQKIPFYSYDDNTPFEQYKVDLDPVVYRARWLLRDDVIAAGSIRTTLSEQTPSRAMIEQLQANGFEDGMTIWEAAEKLSDLIDNPAVLIDFVMEPKDLYAAVLLNALEASSSAELVPGEVSDAFSGCGKFVSAVRDWAETNSVYLPDDGVADVFARMPQERRLSFISYSREWFERNQPELCELDTVFQRVTAGLEVADTLTGLYDRIVSVMTLANLSQQTKDVLRQLYADSKQTNNTALRAALRDCVTIMDHSTAQALDKVLTDECMAAGTDVVQYFFGELLWDTVMENLQASYPAVAVLRTAYKASKLLTNWAASSDALVEQYMNLLAISDLQALAERTLLSLQKEFQTSQSTASAERFLAMVDLMLQLRCSDARQASQFVQVLDSAWISRVAQVFGKNDFSGLAEALEIREGNYATARELAQCGWINNLDEDYPDTDLYDYYDYLYQHGSSKLAKEIQVACPVDITVLDRSGNEIAASRGTRLSADDGVTIIREGDVKTVRVYAQWLQYSLQLDGTDSGTMNVSISEYPDGLQPRRVTYRNVPLHSGCRYDLWIPSGTNVYPGYALTDEDGTTLSNWDSMTAFLRKHTIHVYSGVVLRGGAPAVEQQAYTGETLEIQAYVPLGSQFLGWKYESDVEIDDPDSLCTTVIMPDRDLKLSAIVMPCTYTLRFDAGGGSDQAPVTGSYGDKIDLSGRIPQRAGYLFGGWYDADGQRYDSVTLTQDLTLYARWLEPFVDVKPGQWFYDDVMYVYTGGLMLGTGNQCFSPYATATRAMMATILWRMEGSPKESPAAGFSDVSTGKWYSDAIDWAAESGVFAGYGGGRFGTNDAITREQLATIFYRYARWRGEDVSAQGSLSAFPDQGDAHGWARQALQWAVGTGLIRGRTNGTLDPGGTATRAEIAAILHRFAAAT